jgi:hypothetical protein
MIWQWLYDVMAFAFGWLWGMIPSWSVPSMVLDVSGELAKVAGWIGPLCSWLPFQLVAPAIALVFVSWSTGLAIKAAKLVISLGQG